MFEPKNLMEVINGIHYIINKEGSKYVNEFKITEIDFKVGEAEDKIKVTYIIDNEERKQTYYLMK